MIKSNRLVKLEQFSNLEIRVEELIERYQSLKEEKERLESDLKTSRERAEALEAELGELNGTRREVLKRVDDLIHHLEAEG